ncbi:uncharacterized protein LOC108812679 [Raphanus sativus]|uniref:Uncharacterized protein LOC108812679 n=1 Tax=Raphanus sativus TaxID=3726 RepID=A0A9W3C2H5_RAPSA|nr:uncharacterized protein LOC108812679 [Raphanus sativus]XP_056845694.1 uncharacterized protein LOC108812679 [Raphanus sativus]
MLKLKSKVTYYASDTLFFWNMDHFPVPRSKDLTSVRKNIIEALGRLGFVKPPFICVDCKKLNVEYVHDALLVSTGRIFYGPKLTQAYHKLKAEPSLDLTLYMLILEAGYPGAAVAVIVKPFSVTSELRRVLSCLKARGHTVLLVEPPPYVEFDFGVDSLIDNARFLGEEKPIMPLLSSENAKELAACFARPWTVEYLATDSDEEDDVDEEVEESRTVIFWDAIDSPFPISLSPDQIFEKVKSALIGRAYSDNITIRAYREVEAFEKFARMPLDSRINFFHGDDEASRRIRMLNDMYLLSREAPLKNNVGSLILVSDHFFDDPYYMEMFEDMKDSGYSLVLVIPSEHSNISESADKWPGSLLFDGARYFGGPERRVLKVI